MRDKERRGFTGKHHTEKTKRMMSNSLVGRKSNKKNKSYEEIYGEERAQEIIQKMKESRLKGLREGRILIWNKGKSGIFSEETLERLSEIHKYNWEISKEKINSGNFKKSNKIREGMKHTEESKKLMSESHKGQKAWNKGKKGIFSKEAIESNRNKHMGKKYPLKEYPLFGSRGIVFPKEDTSIEVKIQDFLKKLGIEFYTHQYMHIEHSYRCDIFIPSKNLVIECDGTYWHKYPTGTEIDHIRTKELLEKGFKVLRLWEFEIREMHIDKFKEKLENE